MLSQRTRPSAIKIESFLYFLAFLLLFSSGGVKADDKSFSTGYTTSVWSQGGIFEIVPKNGPISVSRIDINMGSMTDTIVIRTAPGIEGSNEAPYPNDESWTVVGSYPNTVGQGKDVVTELPDLTTGPVIVLTGEKQAFYVSPTPGANTQLWNQGGGTGIHGDVYASNEDMDVLQGHSMGYWNGEVVTAGPPRLWSGIIHYSVLAEPTQT